MSNMVLMVEFNNGALRELTPEDVALWKKEYQEMRLQRDKLLETAKNLVNLGVLARYQNGHWDLTSEFWEKWKLLQLASDDCTPKEASDVHPQD